MIQDVTPARAESNLTKVADTGIIGLDEILGGGFPRAHMYLIEGDPGVGKTTLGLQFCRAGAARGERVLYITMSESDGEIRESARSHGWDLKGVEIYYHTPAQAFDSHQTMLHPAEVELPETTRVMLDIIEKSRPHRIVIDSLSEFRVLASDDRWYRRQILALKEYFAQHKYTVLLLDDRTSQSLQMHRHLHSIVTGVIELEQVTTQFGPARRRLRVIKLRSLSYRDGFHDMRLTTGGIEIYPRLVAAEHRAGFAASTVSSGIKELDQLLGGGIDRGTATLLMGPAGVGKSIASTQYAVAAAKRGDATAIYLFDERVQTYIERSRGLNLELEPWIKKGLITITQVDPAELPPGQFAHTIRQNITERNIKIVVIDSLSGYLHAMSEEQHMILHLHELLSFLGQQGVTSLLLLTLHGIVGPNMSTPIDVSFLADNVLLFRYFEHCGEVKQAVSVFKRRGGPHERTIRELRISNGGLKIGEPLTKFRGVLTGTPHSVDDQMKMLHAT